MNNAAKQVLFRIAFAALVLFPIAHREAAWFYLKRGDNMIETMVILPGPDSGFHPPPRALVQAKETSPGLTVYVPVGDDKCWDAPLPCTPRYNAGLRLRRSNDLGSGFVIERKAN